MKTLNSIFTLTLTLLLNGVLYSQNITGTLGTGGLFSIRTTSDTLFRISQSTGNVSLFRNMELGGITSSTSTRGVITKGGIRFIHNYQAPGTYGFNIFMGVEAGNFTMSGNSIWQASYNTGIGYRSLYALTSGYNNSALGYGSLIALTTGNSNTAVGLFAGNGITTGSNNTVIGFNAQVPNNTGDNQIRLGNTSITYAGIQVAWTVTSDRRYKDNITPIGLGLGFISKLNPVSYVRKNDEKGRIEYGLIAQEVEQVLKDLGIENHAMLTITDEGMYELRYNDLIAPMIKAIQELKEKSDAKDIEIAKLKGENKEIKSQLNEIIQVVNELKEKQDAVKNVKFGEK
jgi:galactitol-specific phosphotransferase system IIB component